MKRVEVLDGLRGLAVFIVFFSHTSGRGQTIIGFLNFHGIGHIGVYLFFTLSAFLLGLGLFTKSFNSKVIKSFFIKRIFRIVPLYYVVVTGVFLFQFVNNSYSPEYLHVSNGFQGYLQHLYFFRGDGVFWSIVSEFQFYLVVPILAWVLLKYERKGMVLLLSLAFINFVLYLMKYANVNDVINYFSPNALNRGTFIDIFIPGLITAYFVSFKEEYLKKNELIIHKMATFLLVFGGLLTLILVSKNFLGFNRLSFNFRYLSLLFGASFSLITLSLYMHNPWISGIFKQRFLRFIGKVGYSFYLLHMAVFEIVNKMDVHHTVKFFISLILITTISYISFHLIEKPSIKSSYWLINKLNLSSRTVK